VASIASYEVEYPIKIYAKGLIIRRPVHAKKIRIIPANSVATIEIHNLALPARDYFFKPQEINLSIYAGLINEDITLILVKNGGNKLIRIPRNIRLGEVIES